MMLGEQPSQRHRQKRAAKDAGEHDQADRNRDHDKQAGGVLSGGSR
jgi:hypothetical protein